jgi:ABC-type multidrug transport system fused ATPase/permease subunit
MAAFDPRLLRRAREARVALVADTLLGTVSALLVLAQAVLLADVAARSFDGASLHQVVRPLVLLAAVVCARAASAWGFEVVGRRAAGGILSRLRLSLVERRLRDQPASLDGAESSELASLAVRESMRSRRRSPATSRRSCWRFSFPSRCSPSSPRSTSPRPGSCC